MKCQNCGAENPEGQKFCGECGISFALLPSAQYGYVPVRMKRPYRLRVNILCLIGAVVAVLSLFLPWMAAQDLETDERTYFGAFDFSHAGPRGQVFSDSFRNSVTLFVIGAILAFVTSLSGILLVIGSVGFVLTLTASGFQDVSTSVWTGWMLAAIAAGFVIIGLIMPIGPGYAREGEDRISARLLIWSLYR